jgi:hypothetical protein
MAADAGSYDGFAGSHGFQQRDGETFPQARQDHQIAGGEQVIYILAKPEKDHSVCYAQITGQTM